MNGPVRMFKTRQIIQHDLKVELPKCMYRMKNIHADTNDVGPLGDHVSPFEDTANITKQNLENTSEMSTLIDRQERILQQLDDLRQQMINLKSDLCTPHVVASTEHNLQIPKLPDVVLKANPEHPPFSLLLVKKLCSKLFNLKISTHLHSTVTSLSQPARQFEQELSSPSNINLPTYTLRLIWKNVGPTCELTVSQLPIWGESNMLRYLARLMPQVLRYETEKDVFEIDSVLDLSCCLVRAKTKTERLGLIQTLNKKLGKSKFLFGCSKMTIADVAASSAIKQVALTEITQNMSKWLQRCDE